MKTTNKAPEPKIPSACPLELLQPEIQRQILLQADNPLDLHAMVQASPRLLQVFRLNKQYILSAVACRQFHPALITEAVTFAKMSQLEQPLSRENALKYCHIDQSKLREWQDSDLSIPESIKLNELANNIRFFTQDLANTTLPIMRNLGSPNPVDMSSEYKSDMPFTELSDSETGRLQRAFCRFETYRLLFAKCFANMDHNATRTSNNVVIAPGEQVEHYLLKFPDFQITEMNCVRDFLYRRLWAVFAEVEKEAVQNMSPEPFIFKPRDRLGRLSEQWDSPIFLLTHMGKTSGKHQIEKLISLGLPHIRKILRTSGEKKRELFLHIEPPDKYPAFHLKFLTPALDLMTFGEVAQLVDSNPDNLEAVELKRLQLNYDPLLDRTSDVLEGFGTPDAWQWAHPEGRGALTVRDHCSRVLREWGYVFWDSARLRDSGILDKDPWEAQPTYWSPDTMALLRPSVQQRLLEPLGIWYAGQRKKTENHYGPFLGDR